jgi:hypothetical protein
MMISDKRGILAVDAKRAGRGGGWLRARPVAEILEARQLLATITVTSAGDADDGDGGTTLSLRQAIEISNGTLAISALSPTQAALVAGVLSSPNTIDFAIIGTGPYVIMPTTALPAITNPVVIDGYSQPGAHPNTNGPGQGMNTVIQIELDGTKTPLGSNGLVIQAGNSTVRGLAIGGFPLGRIPFSLGGNGILLEGRAGNLIQGNFLGTDATGSTALPNNVAGIQDLNRYDPSTFLPFSGFNTIGGTTPGAGNVISGNAGDGLSLLGTVAPSNQVAAVTDLIQGNFIGLNAAGTAALPNQETGLRDNGGGRSTVGGTTPEAGNVISGSGSDGLLIGGITLASGAFVNSADLVQGNLIGTNAVGNSAVPNGGNGIMDYATLATIGGTTPGAGNVISGNRQDGLEVEGQQKVITTDLSVSFMGTEASVVVLGNRIGTAADGTSALPNGGDGIYFFNINGASTVGGTAAGAGNVIAYNGGDGVNANHDDANFPTLAPTILISGNAIFRNVGLGIARSAASTTPTPTLSSAMLTGSGLVIGGSLVGLPSTAYTIELFSNPQPAPLGAGPGQVYLGSTVAITDATGHASFSFTAVGIQSMIGPPFTATATDPTDNTSQFAPNLLGYTLGTITTLVGPGTPATLGQSLTFTAFVASPGGIPTGDVTFLADGVVIGMSPVGGNGLASFATDSLSPGIRTITASYVGDGSYSPSLSNVVALNIQAPAFVILLGSNRVATQGQPVTFSALGSAGGVPPGSVLVFFDGENRIGSGTVNANGEATIVTDQLSPGLHVITAAFSGDATHPPSAPSNAIAVNVFNVTAFGGPSVTSDVFVGPSAVTVTFNRGLLLAPAQDIANYKIIGPNHKAIAITSAVYNPANASVTLTTGKLLEPHKSYQLLINGQSGERVVDVFGIALNGHKAGKPGHNYSGKIQVKRATVVKVTHPKATPKPVAHASAHQKGR